MTDTPHPDRSRAELEEQLARGEASDGFHTHNELYRFRLLYNAHAANEWVRHGTYPVVKSWRHHDGAECLGGGWFIVVTTLPGGQVSNHYRADDCDLFTVPEVDQAPEHDGHTAQQAAARLRHELEPDQRPGTPAPSGAGHLNRVLILEAQLRELAHDLEEHAATVATDEARELATATAAAAREMLEDE